VHKYETFIIAQRKICRWRIEHKHFFNRQSLVRIIM